MRSATLRAASLTGISPRGASVDLRSRLLLHLSARRRRSNPLSAGFTLVELMIVIVIVGILSAIAIPNFLAQTEKAKATEAKTTIAAILKQGHADYQEDPTILGPTPNVITLYKAPAANTTKFNYAGTTANGIFTVVATVNPARFGTLSTTQTTITGCVNLTTGSVFIQSYFNTPGPDATCTGPAAA
jgi:type IV pilus assembly protein PilA